MERDAEINGGLPRGKGGALRSLWGVIWFAVVILGIVMPAGAGVVDSLQMWAKRTFWGHYVPRDSLFVSYERALADDDMPTAIQLAAALSFVEYETVDSALLDLGYCYIRAGDFSSADEVLSRAAKIYGKSSQIQYLRALAELYSGDPKGAIKILKRALKKARTAGQRKFLSVALAMMEILHGDLEDGFDRFRRIEDLKKIGFGKPMYEARLLGVRSEYNTAIGTLWVRQYYGFPSMVLRIRPVFRFVDGTVWVGKAVPVEQVASILGSPFFQVNVERSGIVHIPRWNGVPISASLEMWFVYLDENDDFDSILVKVSGELTGYAPADSFSVAVDELRRDAIVRWFDTLARPLNNPVGTSFWRFVLSRKVGEALADSSQWDRGIALVDSIIQVAPYLWELYLWRGAFSLFKGGYQEAYRYFSIPLKKHDCLVDALYDAGVAKFFLGDYRSADSLFARAVECDSLFAPAYLARGVLAQDFFDNPDSAAIYYKKYLSLTDFLRPEVEQWLEEMGK